jgi:DNA-binding transcriptional LysR family regulator
MQHYAAAQHLITLILGKMPVTQRNKWKYRTMDIASQMILFANVVDHGSFSSTARDLGLTPSAVSKQIGHLEDRLGVRLLNRSTRQISLTEEGRPFYARCAEIAAEVVEAEAMAHSMGERPQGNLRVAATVAFGKSQLLPLMPAFIAGFPELKVTLELTDRPFDLTESSFDIAIRVSEQIEDSSLIARKLTSNKRVICAAPSYIETHGKPKIPEDLADHNCLRISTVAHWNEWHFRQGGRDWYHHADGNFDATVPMLSTTRHWQAWE